MSAVKILASCDDGAKLDLKVAELLSKYSIDCIFYIPSAWTLVNILNGREPLNPADLIDLSDKFEIGGHTITHPMLTRIPKGQAYKEIVDCKFHLQYITGKEINSFAYPKGYAHEVHKDIVRKWYKTGRSVEVGYLNRDGDPAFQGNTVHVAGVKRRDYQGSDWLTEARHFILLARQKEDSIFSFFCHSWEIDKFNQWENFEIFLKELTQ